MWIISGYLVYFFVVSAKATIDYLQHPVQTCRIGDVVENECNKCLCSTKNVFECTPKNCTSNQYNKENETSEQKCLPNHLYVQHLITCICTKDGKWPHKSCHDTFLTLPHTKVVKYQCAPNTYVPVDCNVCRCGPEGEILSDRCTRNICEDDNKRRAYHESDLVYSKCEMKNWYSLAPCQFCYCVNQNKLVCNTGNYYSKKLDLGSYSLRVCGKDVIKEAIELIPKVSSLRLSQGLNNATITMTTPVQTTTKTNSITTTIRSPNIFNEKDNHNLYVEVNRESNENKIRKGINNENIMRKPEGSYKEYENIIRKPESSYNKYEKIMTKSESNYKEYESDSDEDVQKVAVSEKSAKPLVTTPSKIVVPVKFAIQQKSTIRTPSILPPTATPEYVVPSTQLPYQDSSEQSIENNDDDTSAEIVVEFDQIPTTLTTGVVRVTETTIVPEKMMNKLRGQDEYQFYGNTLKINLPKVLNKVFEIALRKSMVSIKSGTKCVPGSTTKGSCNNICFCLKNGKLLCTNNKCTEMQ